MRKISLVPALAVLYISIIVALGWGFAIGKYGVFPYLLIQPVYQEIVDFVRGDQTETTSTLEKLQSDLGAVPFRYLKDRVQLEGQDFELREVDVEGGVFLDTRGLPLFFSRVNQGYYLAYGVFEFTAGRFGALLVDSQGRVVRTWSYELLTEDKSNRKGGFDPLSGTLISNASSQLQALDFCGKPMWTKTGLHSHHSIEANESGQFWNFNELYFEKRSVATGDLDYRFSVIDIIKANPDIHVLEPRLKHAWRFEQLDKLGVIKGVNLPRIQAIEDPYHFNDISPLTESMAPFFPQFRKGDLLISSNFLNLVMILRPETRKILWYRYGLTGQQHDPDFNPDGEISVYNNNAHGKYSSIDSFHVDQHTSRVLFYGESLNFHTAWQGNHTILDDRSIVIAGNSGRFFHVDQFGDVLFYFDNLFHESENLEVTNVWHLSDEAFERLDAACQ